MYDSEIEQLATIIEHKTMYDSFFVSTFVYLYV